MSDDADTETDAGADETTTQRAVLAGPDEDALGEALAAQGIEIERVEGLPSREALENAGIADCSLFVLTDVEEATAIPVAKECNPDLQVVIYARGSLPEFTSRQTDLLVDPDLLEPAIVAEELAA
ncbi:CTP synthetase [Halobacteriales archaeon QS_3_64_16]|nr:MAG: CTP synthetase [Halobacteriales archaeon QS_3_64_16]